MPTITESDVGSVALSRRPKCSFIVVQDDVEDDSIYFLLSGEAHVFVNVKRRDDIQRTAPVRPAGTASCLAL